MFAENGAFNQPLTHWNLESVTSAESMFAGASAFQQTLDCWAAAADETHLRSLFHAMDVSSLNDACWMERGCAGTTFTSSFELRQAVVAWTADWRSAIDAYGDIACHWNIGQVDDLSHLFHGLADFNADISRWQVGHATNTISMFEGATSFNVNVGAWDLGNVQHMARMFKGAASFAQKISDWDVSSVLAFQSDDRDAASLQLVFAGSALADGGLDPCWYVVPTDGHGSNCPYAVGDDTLTDVIDTYVNDGDNATYSYGAMYSLDMSGVTDMSFLFANSPDFNVDVSRWDVSSVVNMQSMFENATSFDQDLSGWDVSKVGNLESMFKGATSFAQDLGGWSAENAALADMFDGKPPCYTTCTEHGRCIDDDGDDATPKVCVCENPAVFTGDDCEINGYNNCAENECGDSSTCIDGDGGHSCKCFPGYVGAQCTTLADVCATKPCMNGGDCTNSKDANGNNNGAHACGCRDGFDGDNCAENVDECSQVSAPCTGNGRCVDGDNAYTCDCNAGFSGKTCELNKERCSFQRCSNRGDCADASGEEHYTCTCYEGFGGTDCENDILDHCAGVECLNGGTCKDMGRKPDAMKRDGSTPRRQYRCECATGFGGESCADDLTDDCAGQNCFGRGQCIDQVSGYACNCDPGFTGKNCESEDDCIGKTCSGRGECVDGLNDYACNCTDPLLFFGKDCQIEDCALGNVPSGVGYGDQCTVFGSDGGPGESCTQYCDAGYTDNNDGSGQEYTCPGGVFAGVALSCTESCADQSCSCHGTCIPGNNAYSCECDEGSTGHDCQHLLGVDLTLPCTGRICAHVYNGISGTSVASLTSNAKYPNSPDETVVLGQNAGNTGLRFPEFTTSPRDTYGVLIEGYLVPPATAAYTFSTNSDDASEVYIEVTKGDWTKVVELTGCCTKVRGTVEVNLVAGQPYWLKALLKEGSGGDYIYIGFSYNGIEEDPIPVSYFATPDDFLACTTTSVSSTTTSVTSTTISSTTTSVSSTTVSSTTTSQTSTTVSSTTTSVSSTTTSVTGTTISSTTTSVSSTTVSSTTTSQTSITVSSTTTSVSSTTTSVTGTTISSTTTSVSSTTVSSTTTNQTSTTVSSSTSTSTSSSTSTSTSTSTTTTSSSTSSSTSTTTSTSIPPSDSCAVQTKKSKCIKIEACRWKGGMCFSSAPPPACTKSDGCAGCTEDGDHNDVAGDGSDCSWHLDAGECHLRTRTNHCQVRASPSPPENICEGETKKGRCKKQEGCSWKGGVCFSI